VVHRVLLRGLLGLVGRLVQRLSLVEALRSSVPALRPALLVVRLGQVVCVLRDWGAPLRNDVHVVFRSLAPHYLGVIALRCDVRSILSWRSNLVVVVELGEERLDAPALRLLLSLLELVIGTQLLESVGLIPGGGVELVGLMRDGRVGVLSLVHELLGDVLPLLRPRPLPVLVELRRQDPHLVLWVRSLG